MTTLRSTRTAFRVAAAATGIAVMALIASPVASARTDGSDAAGTVAGCPVGAFCIYPGATWNNGHPEYVFYSYGAHNIYNEIGTRWTYNNQYPDGGIPPTVAYCYGSNGTGGAQFANNYLGASSFDATPINSIELIKPSGGGDSISVCPLGPR